MTPAVSPTLAMSVLALVALPVEVAARGEWPEDLPQQSLDVHFTIPSYSQCAEASVMDAALSCESLNGTYSDFGFDAPNFAWIIVGRVEPTGGPGSAGGIGGVQFGIEYDPGLVVVSASTGGWALCTGGEELPETGWPKSGYGNAATWTGGCYEVTDNPDGMTRVGYFPVRAIGPAEMRVVEDPRRGRAVVIDCDGVEALLCRQLLGTGHTEEGLAEAGCRHDCIAGRTPTRTASWGSLKSLY